MQKCNTREVIVRASFLSAVVLVAVPLSTAALPSSPARAVELSGNAAVVSDYRFRGESLSNRQPVGEANLQASLAGWFAGLSVESSATSRAPAAVAGRHPEIDVSGGWSKTFGLLTPAAGVIGYIYPGGSRTDSFEAFASLAAKLGPAALTGGINYAPRQANLGRDNLYLSLSPSVGIPGTPLTFRAVVGREAGSLQGGRRSKLDYGAGIEAQLRRLTLSARWSANDLGASTYDRRRSRPGVSLSIGTRF